MIKLFFFRGIGEPKYMPVLEWASLNKILTDALKSYNELNAAMDLVILPNLYSKLGWKPENYNYKLAI